MAEGQSTSMQEEPCSSRAPQKVIIIKSNPAVQGIKRKLDCSFDCSSGNLEQVQKPIDTTLTPCSSFSASHAVETRGKNIILYNQGSKPLVCTLPKSTVLQNLNQTRVVTQSTGQALPKITFVHKNSQLMKTATEVVGKTLPNETPILPRQLSIGGGTDPGCTKPTRKGFLILRGKKVDGINSNDMLKPVRFTLGQLMNRSHVLASNSSAVSYPFLLKDSSKNELPFPHSAQNTDTIVVPLRGSAVLQDQGRSSKRTANNSDAKAIVDNASTKLQKRLKNDIWSIPTFRQYYAIHCPFHGDFNTYTKHMANESKDPEGDNGIQREPCFPLWSGSCPICCSYCVSVCDSTDELFHHMDVHRPWLQFVDVACHLCPLDKHLPTMEKLEFDGWCNWPNVRLSTLGDHLQTSHNVDPELEPNPHEQVYNVLIDPAKVKPTVSNSVRFVSPLEFSKHMMQHFHVLSCRLVCSVCLRRRNGFGDVEGKGENDLDRLEQHYQQFHPADLNSIPIVFQLTIRPGRLKKPNGQEIANKNQTLLSSVKSCFKPKSELQNKTEFDKSGDAGDEDMIPLIRCPFRSSGCEFRTSDVGHVTDHVDWHMAAVPLRWRVFCHKCCAVFDNFLDAMLHLSQKTCSSLTVNVLTSCDEPATQVIVCENVEDCFSRHLSDDVTLNALNYYSASSDILAQRYVTSFMSPEVDSLRKPVSCQSVLSIVQIGLFLAVQPHVGSSICSSKWEVITDDDPSSLAECKRQRLFSEVQLKKSVSSSSNPALKFTTIPSKTSIAEDTLTLQNTSGTGQMTAKCSETSTGLRTVTLPSRIFNQLLGTKDESSNVQQVKLLVNANNNLQLQNKAQSDEIIAAKSKCGSKLKVQMLNKSLPLKNRLIHVEPFRPKAVPIVDTSRNLNRSAYAEIETLFIGQQYGINENVKVIIKEINSDLQYQCPYCIYGSQVIFHVANHLVQEHDNADLELNDTNSIHLKTHMLLMHCRLCDYVTHHHPSLLWHLQGIHDVLDEPPKLDDDDDVVEPSQAAALQSKRIQHFRCARFSECAFASASVSAVVRHSYQEHAGDSDMFGIGHVTCSDVSFGILDAPDDVRITTQFVCAHCHEVTPSWKAFAAHYLFEHASRLLYICMYCEAHLNSLASIIKHIDYRHAGFERLICSVMFIGDLGVDDTTVVRREQSQNVVVDTKVSSSGIVTSHHGLSSVFSVPHTDVKTTSGSAKGSSVVCQSTSLLTNSHPVSSSVTGAATAVSSDSIIYANVKKIEGSKSCHIAYKGRDLWLPYSIVAPLLKRP